MSAPDLNTQHTLSLQIRHQSVHTVRTEWVCCRLAVLGSHVTPRSASTIHRRLPAYLAFRIRYLLAGLAGNYVRYGYYPYPTPHCSVLLSPAAAPACLYNDSLQFVLDSLLDGIFPFCHVSCFFM